eukprot:461188_1
MAGAVSSNVQFTRVCVHAKKTYLCNDERNDGLPVHNQDNYVDPLAPYWGRVEIPYQHDSDVDEAQDNEYRATDGLDEFEADVLRQIHDENAEKRIEAKQAKEDQEMSEVMTYIKHWERTKNVCPLCCWIALLIIILISTFSVAVNSD